MHALLENPLPILAMGGVLATLTGLAFLSRRSLSTLIAFACVVVLTLLLLAVEWLVVTPREHIEASLTGLLAAVEANDTAGVLTFVDPSAIKLRSDVESLMPTVDVEDTGATAIDIQLASGVPPTTATSQCKGRLRGVHRNSGMTVMYFDQVEFQWVCRDEQWLLAGFTPYWKGKALDPVGSLQGSQPEVAPAR